MPPYARVLVASWCGVTGSLLGGRPHRGECVVRARWDVNGDGTIDLGEFRRAIAAVGLEDSPEAAKNLFAEFDLDGSGRLECDTPPVPSAHAHRVRRYAPVSSHPRAFAFPCLHIPVSSHPRVL